MTYKPTPPPAPRAVMLEDVPNIDAMRKLGITGRAIAFRLGVHPRTIHNVLARKGAYKEVAK